jgi:hypothetical protein|tara:strand:- start:846 stop:1178 length:333 start_codon:yes stop_codon:yes gene_type:complete
MRCVQCAEVHSLQPDFDVLLKKAEQVLRCAEEAAESASSVCTEYAAGGAEGGVAVAETDGQREVRCGRISFGELRIVLARALQRLSAFAAHERRAAHESKVMEKLLQVSK